MTPYDGSGYGQSMYWRRQLKEIANEKNETCQCWDRNEPKMYFKGDRKFEIIISCNEIQDNCKKNFDRTQKEILERFKNFHKV